MMKKYTILLVLLILNLSLIAQNKNPDKVTEQWDPQPPIVQSAINGAPPSDAIILLDGSNLDEWVKTGDGTEAKWTLENGIMTVKPGTGDIQTKQSFGDVQLHIEWRSPIDVISESQGRGNSGVFLQSRYEIQILDNYQNKTYANGQAGSVYKQHIPLVNACRAPGEWQTYDIIFTAPIFNDDGKKIRSGYFTVFHNGILIQNHVEIWGSSAWIGLPENKAHGKAPIKLQDHGNLVSYRNIWLREL